MADLGAIGVHTPDARSIAMTARETTYAIVLGDAPPLTLSERDTSFGNPLPSLHQRRAGVIRGIWWPVAAGARQLAVDCYFIHGVANVLRPRVHVFAHSAVGLIATLITTVSNNERTWITTTVNITAARSGILEVALELQSTDHQAECWWDNITAN